jgi:hypothetical protein
MYYDSRQIIFPPHKSERCSKNIFNKTVGQTLNSVSRMINIDTARQLVKLLENDP